MTWAGCAAGVFSTVGAAGFAAGASGDAFVVSAATVGDSLFDGATAGDSSSAAGASTSKPGNSMAPALARYSRQSRVLSRPSPLDWHNCATVNLPSTRENKKYCSAVGDNEMMSTLGLGMGAAFSSINCFNPTKGSREKRYYLARPSCTQRLSKFWPKVHEIDISAKYITAACTSQRSDKRLKLTFDQ